MQHSESVKEIFGALSKFRAQVKQPAKTAKNPYFNSNYVTLEGVMQSIDAALPGTGLAYCQLVENGDNGVSVSTLITHSSGEWMIVGPLTLAPTKRDPQGQGSAITYAKRYQLASAFGISSDIDDDGNACSFGEDRQSGYQRQSAQNKSYRGQNANQGNRQTAEQKARHDQASAVMDEVADVKHKAETTFIDSSGTSLLDLCRQSKQEGGKGPAHQRLEAWIAENPEVSISKHKFIKRIGELNIV
ncbi:ERF family protein [Lactobacillus delbrueckii subsp. bulgaricus]|uniref:ORF 244 n=1 Tax=Lactococcus phage mv4 TaxID=12392 RepID=Q9G0C9_BPMV4|nr:ERF family protein [Lactobacillus delbrueckii]AAG31330.1 ORF 244 [Lactobacillus phage mv4]MCD5464884.1 ERF family protein [Lactobacillus delbrueckii subsp. bulgaricus]MCD5482379.1 ERF family protein [Lactobacillus delbrueckii subsp. bulgaricus]MCD5482431.1 ERF family protein [Lactobacillus delbrueckii subsp. bulgaricus]